jgi:hypothetical protein
MGYADQIHCNFPIPTRDSTRTARAAENENAEESKTEAGGEVGGMAPADRNDEIKRGEAHPAAWDAGMSWGASGGTETTSERGAESIPQAVQQSMGIDPENVSSASPTPETLGRPLVPAANHNESWNAASIFEHTKIG